MRRRKKLIFWRIDRRLRQHDIADKLQVTVAHWSNLERGISNPSYELLTKFKETFKVNDVMDLFEQEEEVNGNIDTSRHI